MKKRFAEGYTLVELSIVLVIIGLIAGGILFGRSILTTSRLQTVITDIDSFTTAMGNFKQTYQAVPGDMVNATTVWGTDSSGCPSGGGATGTCNGNGDGKIGGFVSGQDYEAFRFWQQLYLAKMLSYKLSGVASSGGTKDSTIGTNVPPGSMPGSGFFAFWEDPTADTDVFSGVFYGNIFIFGSTYTNHGTANAILTPDQAMSIDAKIDDGFPGIGRVRAPISTASVTPNCTTTTVATTAQYNVSNGAILCTLAFLSGY